MLTLDASGRLLTRTAPGVARWNGTRWQEFSTDNGLADSVIAKAQVDSEGSLWLAPLGWGIWRWRGYDNIELLDPRPGVHLPESLEHRSRP